MPEYHDEELNLNMCSAYHQCRHGLDDPCVYFVAKPQSNYCKHRHHRFYECNSAAAQGNAMFVALKRQGLITPAMLAADEMLEALQEARCVLTAMEPAHYLNEDLREIIAKAEGGNLLIGTTEAYGKEKLSLRSCMTCVNYPSPKCGECDQMYSNFKSKEANNA